MDPLIVTAVPIGPDEGERLLILGDVTVKFEPLLATPEMVTTTLPLDALLGTGTAICVLLQLVGLAVVPLNVTVLDPCVAPKLDPLMVTDVPLGPDVGERPLIAGTNTMK